MHRRKTFIMSGLSRDVSSKATGELKQLSYEILKRRRSEDKRRILLTEMIYMVWTPNSCTSPAPLHVSGGYIAKWTEKIPLYTIPPILNVMPCSILWKEATVQ
jgi:hypothetical protein